MNLIAQTTEQSGFIREMVFHQHPMRRTVLFEVEDCGQNAQVENSYFLSFPQIAYLATVRENGHNISAHDLHVVFMDDNGQIAEIPFPNTYEDFTVCLDPAFADTPLEACKKLIHSFWVTKFSSNLLQTPVGSLILDGKRCEDTGYAEAYCKFLEEWQNKTLANPKWVPDLTMFRPEKENDFLIWHFRFSTIDFFHDPHTVKIFPPAPPMLTDLLLKKSTHTKSNMD